MSPALPHLNLVFWIGFVIAVSGAAGIGALFWKELKQCSWWSVPIGTVVAIGVLVPCSLLVSALNSTSSETQQGVFPPQSSEQALQQARISQQLGLFVSQATNLLSAQITKEQYPIWKQREEKFAKDVTALVLSNLGKRAKDRLLDMSVFTQGMIWEPVVPEQRSELVWLDKVRQNLLQMMQEEAMLPSSTASGDISTPRITGTH
ncbi:MAG: hypothetical protein ACRYFU_22610 [Janthinobacterium lividum]